MLHFTLFQVLAVKSQYGQSESFHSAQVDRLRDEIDSFKRVGKHKEAEARTAYLVYHQQELNKIKSIVSLAGEKGSLMEEAVQALQVWSRLCMVVMAELALTLNDIEDSSATL